MYPKDIRQQNQPTKIIRQPTHAENLASLKTHQNQDGKTLNKSS
jgi:hypothetical protein